MTLYEVNQVYQDFLTAIESGDIPEEAIADTLEGIQEEFRLKADNIACLIKTMKAECEALKAEEKALEERRSSKEHRMDSLRKYLADSMQKTGQMKIETSRNVIGFRKSAALIVDDENIFKRDYPDLCKTEIKVSIPKSEITRLIKSGQQLNGVHLQEHQNLQIR